MNTSHEGLRVQEDPWQIDRQNGYELFGQFKPSSSRTLIYIRIKAVCLTTELHQSEDVDIHIIDES